MHTPRRRPRWARLRQPHPRIPPVPVEVLAVWKWRAIRVARVRFADGYWTEVEADLLAPPT